jgi:hypothetical protein
MRIIWRDLQSCIEEQRIHVTEPWGQISPALLHCPNTCTFCLFKSLILFGSHMSCLVHVTLPTPLVQSSFTCFKLARNIAAKPEWGCIKARKFIYLRVKHIQIRVDTFAKCVWSWLRCHTCYFKDVLGLALINFAQLTCGTAHPQPPLFLLPLQLFSTPLCCCVKRASKMTSNIPECTEACTGRLIAHWQHLQAPIDEFSQLCRLTCVVCVPCSMSVDRCLHLLTLCKGHSLTAFRPPVDAPVSTLIDMCRHVTMFGYVQRSASTL